MRVVVRALLAGLLLALLASPAAAKEAWEGQPPHGRDLMTRVERKTFWREFLALETDEERSAYWTAHNEKMDQRALDWGVSLDPPLMPPTEKRATFWRAPYFSDMMTDDELANYASDLDAIPDREDRRQYVREHVVRMQVRAAERGVSIPSALEFDDVFDGTTADQAGAAAIRAALGYDPLEEQAGNATPPRAAEDESSSADDADSLDPEEPEEPDLVLGAEYGAVDPESTDADEDAADPVQPGASGDDAR